MPVENPVTWARLVVRSKSSPLDVINMN